jgi:hypothetical protein
MVPEMKAEHGTKETEIGSRGDQTRWLDIWARKREQSYLENVSGLKALTKCLP